MVQSVETTPFSEDDAMQAGSMMAGLPPLLLGTYTPKNRRQRTHGTACEISQSIGIGHGDGQRSGTLRLPAAPIGISPDRVADSAHIHGQQGRARLFARISFRCR